jgi:pimeloyl-ACP methyl ester carboxylesterase
MAAERIPVGDLRLSVESVGSGPPVVLLHGFPENSHSWRHQLPALAEAGYRAVAPDLRGYGRSDRPGRVDDYAIAALAGDVWGLIDALDAGPVHLVGHDWGGSLAWVTAMRRPELLQTLTILNSPHPAASAHARLTMPDQMAKSWYMLLFQFPGVAEAWLSNDDFANFRSFVFDTAAEGTFSEEDREIFLAPMRKDGALTAALNYYRANIPAASWIGSAPDTPPVEVPTMIIWGLADANMGRVLLELSSERVGGPLRIEELEGVGHWIQQEAPDAVNRLLVDFLAAPAGS